MKRNSILQRAYDISAKYASIKATLEIAKTRFFCKN